jgi:hypothetical protein
MLLTTAIVTSLLMLPAARAATQDAQTAAPQMTLPDVEQDLGIMKDLAEQSAKLKSETEGKLRTLREQQGVLDTILQDVRGADQFTEELMKLLQEAAGGLASDGAYVKTLQAQEQIARGLEREAFASTNPADRPYAEIFNGQAGEIAGMIGRARDIGGKLTAQVELLKKRKSQIRFAYAAGRIAQFIRNARESLGIYEGILAGASDLAERSGRLNSRAIPSQ